LYHRLGHTIQGEHNKKGEKNKPIHFSCKLQRKSPIHAY